MIGYALTLGCSKTWLELSLVLTARLTKVERTALAYAALRSLPDDEAYRAASLAIFGTVFGEGAR